MINVKFIVPKYSKDPKLFMEHWSSFYAYEFEPNYLENINDPFKNFDSFHQMYIWKNGMKLSKKKYATIKKLYKKSRDFKRVSKIFSEELFEEKFNMHKNPGIWMMFLMHLFQPNNYPLFDQHVYRAHVFLNEGAIKEIPTSNKRKYIFFKEVYIPWFMSLKSSTKHSGKLLDESLFTLGQHLSKIKNQPDRLESVNL